MLGLVIFGAIFCLSDAAITAWTNPVIGTADGTGNITTAIPENTPVGKTSIRIAATGGAGYAIDGSPGPFAINATSGYLSITRALDYETTSSHVIRITAIETGGSTTATATVTVYVGDVNEKPTFATSTTRTCVADGTAKGTSVTTVKATYTVKASTITYDMPAVIPKGTTDFAIVKSNGTVTVAKALNKTVNSSYNLTITAIQGSDNAPKNTATMFLLVKVGGCLSQQRSAASVFAPHGLLTLLVVLLAASV